MTMRYAHTNIVARDWRRLAAFYETVFKCVPVPPQRRQSGEWLNRGTGVPDAALEGVHLRLPGHGESGPTLEIYQYNRIETPPQTAANRRGLAHIAFEVADVEAVRTAVIDNGGSSVGEIAETTVPGLGRVRFVYLADPEGNLIEIQSWHQ